MTTALSSAARIEAAGGIPLGDARVELLSQALLIEPQNRPQIVQEWIDEEKERYRFLHRSGVFL